MIWLAWANALHHHLFLEKQLLIVAKVLQTITALIPDLVVGLLELQRLASVADGGRLLLVVDSIRHLAPKATVKSSDIDDVGALSIPQSFS